MVQGLGLINSSDERDAVSSEATRFFHSNEHENGMEEHILKVGKAIRCF